MINYAAQAPTPFEIEPMADYLTHYYRRGTPPFRSLSTLSDDDALQLMTALADDTPYGERFKDPLGYLHNRQRTEQWVRAEYYQPDYHGKVFTRSEILAIAAAHGMPEDGWEPRLPDHLAPCIEAQVWNRAPLLAFEKDYGF